MSICRTSPRADLGKILQSFAGRDITQAQVIPITQPIGPVRKTP